MTQALIIVDPQLDFCPGGALAVPDGDGVIAPINALMDRYEVVVITQDWHPADHTSFADNHPGKAPYEVVDMPYGPQILWPRHCVQGSAGAGFHPDLQAGRADLIIRKGFRPEIDSYSAFYENDRETPTGLAGYLRERGVRQVALAGLAFDFCVAWSAMDAVALGFGASVLRGACRAIDLDGSADKAAKDMTAKGVILA